MSDYNPEWARQYYQENKERIKERNKQWREANPDKMKAAQKRYKTSDNPAYSDYNSRNYEKFLWQSAKRNAEKHGLPFDLDIEDIVIPEFCPFLEIPLTRIRGAGRLSTNASIDKIIPTHGYVKGNIQIISEKANRMKQDASIQELVMFARNVLKEYD